MKPCQLLILHSFSFGKRNKMKEMPVKVIMIILYLINPLACQRTSANNCLMALLKTIIKGRVIE